jgi:hypothetical protein
LKTFRGRHASLLCQIHLDVRRLVPQWRSESSLLRFCQAPMVGVPIAEVANILAHWLHWMAGSYVGHLDTKTTSLRSACRKYLGLAIPRYVYNSANLVWHPGCVTFRGRCALVALDTQNFTSGMKASLWGVRLMALLSTSGCLGALVLRPS